MSIPSAEDFIRKMMVATKGYDRDAFEVYFGVVESTSDSGRLVKVKRQGVIGTDADSGYGMIAIARVVGPPLEEDDVVLCLRDYKDHYVIGEVGGDGAITISSVDTPVVPTGGIQNINFTTPFNVATDGATGIEIDLTLGGNGASVYPARSDVYLTNEADRGIAAYFADGAPTTSSNSSTSTYATLYDESIELPSGTWIVQHIAMVVVKNSVANGGATVRTSSPSASGGTTVTCPTANAPFTLFDTGGGSGLTGTQSFAAEYRANTRGTVTPQRWLMIVNARRTA